MLQMVYWSRPAFSLDRVTLAREIRAVLEASRKNNRPLQITGVLAFSKDWFLQVLEGPSNHVLGVFEKIALDRRHREIMVLGRRERAVRDFPVWDMAFVPATSGNARLIKTFCGSDDLDPRTMAPERLFELMRELVNRNAKVSVTPLTV